MGETPRTAFGDPSEVKRLTDLAIIAVAHAILAPVFLLVWIIVPLLIVLDTGRPVFYRQRRVGRYGREFDVLKFRTMIQDAEAATGEVWSSPADPRVTRVGRMLRATALDELPQVLNIARGEMTFVGPRPERPDTHRRICRGLADFDRRLDVTPGLTGLAQVHGRYDTSPEVKLAFDLRYIRERSFWLDLRLVLASGLRTVSGRWSTFEEERPSGAPSVSDRQRSQR